jgi:hypothetical protein
MLKHVTFYSEGVKLAGDLFLPADIKRAARRKPPRPPHCRAA